MESARGWSGRRPLYFSTAGFTPVRCQGVESIPSGRIRFRIRGVADGGDAHRGAFVYFDGCSRGMESARGWSGRRPLYFSTADYIPVRCRGGDQFHRAGSVSRRAVSRMGATRGEGHLSISMNVRAGMETARGWSGRRPLYFSTAGFTPVRCQGGDQSHWAGSVSRHGDRIARANLRSPAG